MVKYISFLFLFLPVFLFAQYPATGNKQRLGYQTTGDGLIWRGVAADTAIKPRTINNAYFQLDTVNGILRRYIATRGMWQTVGGGGLTMPLDSLVFNPTTAEPDTAELKYNADLETFVFGADGTVIEIGQKSAWYVKNQTGSTITKGTVVRASGTLGSSGRILVSPMVIDGTVDSKYLLGITASDIADGSDGYVIHFGKLRKFNTSSWADGTVLYAGTGGTLTSTEPNPPNLRLPIAFVVHSHATNGILAIRIQTGNELHELHDVDTTGIANGGSLVWDAGTEKWIAAAADNDRDSTNEIQTLFFDSVTGDLDISGGNTVSLLGILNGYTSGTGTAGRIPYWNTTTSFANSPILYNSTTKRTTWDSPGVIELPMGTDAQRPSPATTSDFWYNTTGNGIEWYNGTRWAKGLESTANRFATGQIIHTDANQQAIGSSNFTHVSNKLTLGVPSGSNPVVDIVTGTGDGTVNESAGFRLRNRTNNGNTFYLQMGTSNVAAGGSNQGFAYMQSGMWGGAYTNPLFINPKGGFVGFGSVFTAEWELSVKNAIGINAPNFPPSLGQGGKLVFSSNKGLNAPAQIVAWYDQSSWEKGVGLVFKTESGVDVSGAANQGIERMRISSDGLVGIGKTPVTYLLDVGGTTAIGFPRGTTAQRPTWVTSTSPVRFNTDSTAFEYATAAGTWSLLATRAYARSLVAGLPTTWLKTELEAGRDVNIAGGSSTDFRIQNTRVQFDGRVKFGADSVFTYDPVQDTFFIGGNGKFGKQPTDDAFIDYSFRNLSNNSTAILIESGRAPAVSGTAQLVLRPTGSGRGALSYGNTVGGNQLGIFSDAKGDFVAYFGSSSSLGGNSNTVLMSRIDDPIQWGYNGKLVVYDTISSGKALFLAKKVSSNSTPIAMFSSSSNDRFTFNDDGVARFHTYGIGTEEAADLSKTESVYSAWYATDGTVIEKRANTEQYFSITSTSSPQTLSNTISDNLINQGGTQATFTLTFPASPVDGQVLKITYNNAITTLTLDGNGNTIVGSAVTTGVAGSQRAFKFYTGIGWIKLY